MALLSSEKEIYFVYGAIVWMEVFLKCYNRREYGKFPVYSTKMIARVRSIGGKVESDNGNILITKRASALDQESKFIGLEM